MKWKWDQYLGGGHTTKKMAALMKGIISKLPSEYFGENIFVGASTMSKEEIRRRHVHRLRRRDVGHRLPASRRHVAEHRRAPAQRLRRRAGRRRPQDARRDRGPLLRLRPRRAPARSASRSARRRRPRPGRLARHRPRGDPRRASGGRTSTRCSPRASRASLLRAGPAHISSSPNRLTQFVCIDRAVHDDRRAADVAGGRRAQVEHHGRHFVDGPEAYRRALGHQLVGEAFLVPSHRGQLGLGQARRREDAGGEHVDRDPTAHQVGRQRLDQVRPRRPGPPPNRRTSGRTRRRRCARRSRWILCRPRPSGP